MGSYTVISGQPLTVYLEADVVDNGWVIHSGYAEHSACNSGFIRNVSFSPEEGKRYLVSYEVFDRTSGNVQLVFGGVSGSMISQNGEFSEEFVAANGTVVFWSDGNLKITNLRIAEISEVGKEAGYTLSFNVKHMLWTGYKSFTPEYMTKFIDGFFGFKSGEIWKHNATEVRNNFYGEQYKSVIEFYVNVNASQVKTFQSIRIESNKAWSVTDIEIPPREGKSKGQKSRIKKGNFKVLQGDYFADFLRDLNDARFPDEAVRLIRGALLQGKFAKIRIEMDDTSEVRLSRIDTILIDSQFTF